MPNSPAATWEDKVRDALERAGWSAGQQFASVIALTIGTAGIGLAQLPWALALGLALGAFVVSLVLTGIQYLVGLSSLPFALDVLVRGAKTFLASLVGTWGANGVFDVFHFSWVRALNIAAIAAIAAVAKSLLSPNAHLSGSTLTTPRVARIQGVEVGDGNFQRAA